WVLHPKISRRAIIRFVLTPEPKHLAWSKHDLPICQYHLEIWLRWWKSRKASDRPCIDASTSANIIIYHAVTKHYSAPPPFVTIGPTTKRSITLQEVKHNRYQSCQKKTSNLNTKKRSKRRKLMNKKILKKKRKMMTMRAQRSSLEMKTGELPCAMSHLRFG
ncbi:hypothetical protein ACHAXN_010597, partial [Cyclotella atomus]